MPNNGHHPIRSAPPKRDGCNNCVHWSQMNALEAVGFCKRYPPRAVIVKNQIKALYPPTTGDDRCGEHSLVHVRV